MFKLFLADIKQLKKPFLFLVLSIPLLHYLDSVLYRYALPTTIQIKGFGSGPGVMSEHFAPVSGWPFAIMASIILLLFSEESGNGLHSRLASLASLPLSRWKIGLLRHLPALTVVPVLGLLLNVYRFILHFFFAITKNDAWSLHRSFDFKTTVDCFAWAFETTTNTWGTGHASLLFQLAGWVSMSLIFLGIPLLIDDLWPHIKKSSFAVWISSSLFIGIVLQVAVLAFGRQFGLELIPHIDMPDIAEPIFHPWLPSIMGIELMLAIAVMGLELWRFQRRPSYV